MHLMNRIKLPAQSNYLSALLFFCIFIIGNITKTALVYLLCDQSPADYFLFFNLLTSLLMALMFFGGAIFMKGRVLPVLIYLLQYVFLWFNVAYFDVFDSPIHLNYLYRIWWELLSVKDHIFSLPTLHAWFLASIDLPPFILIMKQRNDLSKHFHIHRRKLLWLQGISIVCLVALVVTIEAVVTPRVEYATSKQEKYDAIVLHRYGLLAHNIYDLITWHDEQCALLNLDYGPEIISSAVIKPYPNILLIQVESLDANIIDFRWNGKLVTPFLHELSRNSLYYPYTMSYHKAGGTSDAEISILNSVEPLSDFPTMTSSACNYPNSIIPIVKTLGFTTKAFHGNDGNFYNRDYAYYKMGFDIFFDRFRMRLPQERWGASDHEVFNYALKAINTKRKPFLDYIITMSSHEPFTNVNQYFISNLYKDLPSGLTKSYLLSMTYVDKSLNDFILKVRREHPNTIIVVFGDHTPYVIKNGPFHRAAFMHDGKEFEFVPLIIAIPNSERRMETKKAASFLDIAPTILKLAGLPYRLKTYGEDLLGERHDKIPFREGLYDRQLLYELAKATAR
jgi:lipoteichoic acid synthase